MRTPLNGILGFTALAAESNDFAQVKGYLQKIQASGTLLLNLINDTLELSRIANGKKELKPELVNAAHMFDGLITAMQASADQQQVCLHVDMQLEELGTCAGG
jgi:signal transduction histidine kinase